MLVIKCEIKNACLDIIAHDCTSITIEFVKKNHLCHTKVQVLLDHNVCNSLGILPFSLKSHIVEVVDFLLSRRPY